MKRRWQQMSRQKAWCEPWCSLRGAGYAPFSESEGRRQIQILYRLEIGYHDRHGANVLSFVVNRRCPIVSEIATKSVPESRQHEKALAKFFWLYHYGLYAELLLAGEHGDVFSLGVLRLVFLKQVLFGFLDVFLQSLTMYWLKQSFRITAFTTISQILLPSLLGNTKLLCLVHATLHGI